MQFNASRYQMDAKDFYRTLRVSPKATQEQIRSAYRRLARKHHPDLNHSPFAEERFKVLGEAYEVLGNPEKRAEYDKQFETPEPQSRFSSSFGSASSSSVNNKQSSGFQSKKGGFFSRSRKSRFGAKSNSGQTKHEPSRFSSAENGSSRFAGSQQSSTRFSSPAQKKEPSFGDTKNGSSFSDRKSPRFGTGQTGSNRFGTDARSTVKRATQSTVGETRSFNTPIPDLEVKLILPLENTVISGPQEIRMDIPELNGLKVLHVEIPRGVENGQRIRLKGQGKRHSSGRRGDLVLLVAFQEHATFKLNGRDLHAPLKLAPWEAALGCKVTVHTLDGDVKVTIPAGSSSGRKIRLKGKGMPGRIPAMNGDLLMEVMIAVPEKLSFTERHLLKKLASSSRFNPRDES